MQFRRDAGTALFAIAVLVRRCAPGERRTTNRAPRPRRRRDPAGRRQGLRRLAHARHRPGRRRLQRLPRRRRRASRRSSTPSRSPARPTSSTRSPTSRRPTRTPSGRSSDGQEREASAPFILPANAPAQPYLSIPLQTPDGYQPERRLRRRPRRRRRVRDRPPPDRPRHATTRSSGATDPPILQAYKLDGTLLWTINLGRNIREGAHYTQFMVYDLDGDGRAEIVCKTADGTTDGKGKVIGDAERQPRQRRRPRAQGAGVPHRLRRPHRRGARHRAVRPRAHRQSPGKPRPRRIHATLGRPLRQPRRALPRCVAYLDGQRPSVVMCRGYYTRTTLAAWDFRGGKLTRRWLFDTGTDRSNPYFGQGNHNLSVADVDDDGKDEIVYGGMRDRRQRQGPLLHRPRPRRRDARRRPRPGQPRAWRCSASRSASTTPARTWSTLKTGKVLWRKPSVKAATAGGDKGEGPGRGVVLRHRPAPPRQRKLDRRRRHRGRLERQGRGDRPT